MTELDQKRNAVNNTKIADVKNQIISNGWRTENQELLKLHLDKYRTTIAHEQAKRGWTTNNPEILKLKETLDGLTVAHLQVINSNWRTEDPKILKLKDRFGRSVAHFQAEKGWITTDCKILTIRNKKGWTVAHEQALHGWITEDLKILTLITNNGVSVAHVQVLISDWFTNNLEILKLKTNDGISVAQLQIRKGWLPKEEHEEYILKLVHQRGSIKLNYGTNTIHIPNFYSSIAEYLLYNKKSWIPKDRSQLFRLVDCIKIEYLKEKIENELKSVKNLTIEEFVDNYNTIAQLYQQVVKLNTV